MKALTLHQPWATAVSLGLKSVETRSWATRYRGPLAIHAGAKEPVLGEVIAGWTICQGMDGWTMRDRPPMDAARSGAYVRLPLGAIVATCRLVDVVPILRCTNDARGLDLWVQDYHGFQDWLWLLGPYGDTDRNARCIEDQRPWGDFTPGRWAWLLDDVKPTTERCPRCWGSGDHEQVDPITDERIDPDLRLPCTRCDGEGRCDPVPARGRQGLWEWKP